MNMKSIDPRKFRSGLRARDRAAALHLNNPRITLIDLGWKVRDGRLTNELTVRFHIRTKPKGPTYEAFTVEHPELVLPSEAELGFPVDYIEAAYSSQLWDSFSPTPIMQRDQIFNPLQGGISISNEWEYGYGTLGGLVKDRHTDDTMILSAWHVLAYSAYTRPGLRILQPGLGDGGSSYSNTVARFTRHAMSQGIDAAVAKLEGNRLSLNEEYEIGTVNGAIMPAMDMWLIKSGRASRVTQGIISGVEGEQPIWYGGFQRKIRHIVHIMQTPEEGEVSRGGDSGSWWLDFASRKAAALHIAGSNDPEYALGISMPHVLDALNVDI